MNPQDFLQTAKQLSASSFEADMRSAVSRSYYAALHTAFDALPVDRKPNLKAHDGSTHSKIIGAYDGWSKAPGAKRTDKRLIKDALVAIKTLRKRADYELNSVVNADDVTDSLHHAHQIISLASAL